MQYTYDGSNDKCPLPLVKTRVILKKMLQGDTCLIRISDSGSKSDIPKLLKKQGFKYTVSHIGHTIDELLIELG